MVSRSNQRIIDECIGNEVTVSLSFKADVPVFDANVGIGHLVDDPCPFEKPAQLLKEMQRHGVDRALLYHRLGEKISAFEGNELMMKWTEEGGPFTFQWVASPDKHTFKQLQELHGNGKVTSLRLHAIQHYVPFIDWIYADLLEWIQAEQIPLWISLPDTPTTELIPILKTFPKLKVVFVGAHYVDAMLVRPLLKNMVGSYLELSRYEVLGELEDLKEEFGVERFLYGSYYPRLAMGPMLFYIHRIGLSSDELEAVCGKTLEKILAGAG